jgi:hypothetical protein
MTNNHYLRKNAILFYSHSIRTRTDFGSIIVMLITEVVVWQTITIFLMEKAILFNLKPMWFVAHLFNETTIETITI